MRDGRVLALQIGLRAFADRGGDFLHPRDCRHRPQAPMWSPRWRKRWKALRRARSPIMLSLMLPQVLGLTPRPKPRERQDAQKEGLPCLMGRPQIGADHAKITTPAQRCRRAKTVVFRQAFAQDSRLVRLMALEMAEGQRLERESRCPSRVEEARHAGSGDRRADRGHRDAGPLGRRREASSRSCGNARRESRNRRRRRSAARCRPRPRPALPAPAPTAGCAAHRWSRRRRTPRTAWPDRRPARRRHPSPRWHGRARASASAERGCGTR